MDAPLFVFPSHFLAHPSSLSLTSGALIALHTLGTLGALEAPSTLRALQTPSILRPLWLFL